MSNLGELLGEVTLLNVRNVICTVFAYFGETSRVKTTIIMETGEHNSIKGGCTEGIAW